MKRFAGWCLALCIAFAATPALADEMAMHVGGDLVVDTDGSVRECTVSGNVAPAVRAMVERAVRGWTFEPIVRDGTAIAGRTSYSLKLVATPVDAGYSLRVEDVGFYNPRKVIKRTTPVIVPGNDMVVLAAMRVDASGKVVDAAVLDIQLLDGGGRPTQGVREYEKTVRTALRQWKFEPAHPELGDPEFLSGTITFTYTRGTPSPWQMPKFTNAKPIPWDAAQPVDAEGMQVGQLAAVDPNVKLKTDVVGRTL